VITVWGQRYFLYTEWPEQRRKVRPEAIWAGTVRAFSIMLGVTILAVFWVMVTPGAQYSLAGLFSLAVFLGVLAGGVVSGARAGARGWLHGLLVGLACGLVLLLLAALAGPLALGFLYWAWRLLLLALAGAAGGVAGVNLARPVTAGYRRGLG
jgi:putative membrane protein (TIGR04086 family)